MDVGSYNQHSGSLFAANSNEQSVLRSGPAFGGISPHEEGTVATDKDAYELINQAGSGSNNGVGLSMHNLEEKWRSPGLELELPPRHWRCIVCKKVRAKHTVVLLLLSHSVCLVQFSVFAKIRVRLSAMRSVLLLS